MIMEWATRELANNLPSLPRMKIKYIQNGNVYYLGEESQDVANDYTFQ